MAIDRNDTRPVRVLVVDDSRLLRRGMRAILEASGVTVVGECASGIEALTKVATLAPDVITVDLEMPGLDGLSTIERIMAEHPTPILVVTGDARFRGLDGHFEALMRGAVDLIYKPSSVEPDAPDCLRLVERIRAVARVQVTARAHTTGRRRQPTTLRGSPITTRPVDVATPALVAIGASTGGPGALRTVLDGLGASLPVPIIVVQHMAEEFAEGFVSWLNSQVAVHIQEATVGTRMRAGNAYVAVRGTHIRVGADNIIAAAPGPPNPHRPSVDVLFSSIANGLGKRSIGILLTGMGDDGADGLAAICSTGALTIVQNEATSVVFGMPGAAIERGAAKLVLPLDAIARATRDACRPATSIDRSSL